MSTTAPLVSLIQTWSPEQIAEKLRIESSPSSASKASIGGYTMDGWQPKATTLL
ncbi:hypothetical protein [Paenibacillus alvei]|uniref:hypothetical protein n=1 Tax=Paenibacillus alvei TaxID=44250 RepID=UPI00228131C1|nr:hypothetical protein [Paenibacillus alvei]